MIDKTEYVDSKYGSEILSYTVKSNYLKQATSVINELSKNMDKFGVLYVREAMIWCGMALNINGSSKLQQLLYYCQAIFSKYRERVGGSPMAPSLKRDREIKEQFNIYLLHPHTFSASLSQ